MDDPADRGPRRGAIEDMPGLYRPESKPRRVYIDDDDLTTVRPKVRETVWAKHAADDPDEWQSEGAADDLDDPSMSFSSPVARDSKFRTSVLYTILSTLIPGLGLLGSRHRSVRYAGLAVSLGFVALIIAAAAFFTTRVNPDPGESWLQAAAATAVGIAVGRGALDILTVLVVGIGLLWVALIAGTHLATRPRRLGQGKRIVGSVLVAALSAMIAVPVAVGANYSQVLAATLGSTFGSQDDVVSGNQPMIEGPNPFEEMGRLNILLLGADMNEKRIAESKKLGYGLRTDTIILASIDTKTGKTSLVQIPRNLKYTPFPAGSEMARQFPDGYTGPGDSAEWYVNTIWEKVDAEYPDVLTDKTHRGAEALKQGVEGITGQPVHYFVMLNIDGLRNLIDAMGGVTVNINRRLPIGGSTQNKRADAYLEQGPNQHLDGQHALWYARSRWSTSDYDRMARQSCLIGAITDQANPGNLLTRFEAIAGASSDMVLTDIPAEALEPLVDLALKAQKQPMQRLMFTHGHNGFIYNNPDFDLMRQHVEALLTGVPVPSPTPTETEAEPTEPSPEPSASESEKPKEGAQNVEDMCAYNPVDEDGE